MPNFDDMGDDTSLSEEDLQLIYKVREWALNNSFNRMIVRDGAEHLVVHLMDRVKKLSREKERLEFILGTTIGKLDDPTLSYEQRMLLKQFHQFLSPRSSDTEEVIDLFATCLSDEEDGGSDETDETESPRVTFLLGAEQLVGGIPLPVRREIEPINPDSPTLWEMDEESPVRAFYAKDIRHAFKIPEDATLNFIGDASDGRGLYYTPGHVQVTITRKKSEG